MIELNKAAHYVSDKIDVSSLKIEEYITTDNMIPNRGGVVDCENLPKASRVTRYEPGDILISNIRPYFKKIWFSDRISGCSNDVIVFRANDENWNKKFLYYVLSQDYFFDFMMAGSNGTKMPRGNKKTIPEFLIPDFDIDKQIRIADILSAYDSLIKNNQKQIKLLEEAAQRLYKEWFVDLHFPGYEDVKIVDGLPEGWQKVSLTEIAPIVTGKKDANFGTENGPYMFFTCAQEPIKAPSYSFDCDAVILAGNGDFNVKLFRGQFEAYQRTYVFSPYDSNNLYLLYYAVKDNMRQLFQGASGSTIKFLTKRMLEEIMIHIPDENTLETFTKYCESYQKKIEILNKQITVAKEARDRLFPKLMSGEIEV